MGSGCCTGEKRRSQSTASADAGVGKDGGFASGHRSERRFSNSSALRQRENEINRLNPTDSMDQWREKLLMGIGTSPQAVFRDFPRMNVQVDPAEQGPSPRRSPSPSSGRRGSGEEGEKAASAPAQKPNPLANPEVSRPEGTDRPENTHRDEEEGAHAETTTPEAVSRMFQERNNRVRDTVIKLAAHCGEAQTFGAAFAEAWNEKERQNAAAYLSQQSRQRDSRQVHDADWGGNQLPVGSAPSSTRFGGHDVAEVMDVHQLMRHACLASGMLAPLEAQPSNATTKAPAGPTTDSSSHRDASPFASGTKRARTVNESTSLLPAGHTDAHAPYGSASQHRPLQPSASSASALTDPTYKVCAVTFHVMEFMVQGVMFFPMQRFKHVLWMPWTTHYRDVDWQIVVRSEVISESAYQELRRKRLKWEAAALTSTFPSVPADLILQEPNTVGLTGSPAAGAGAATAAMHVGGSLSHISTPRQASASQRILPMSASRRLQRNTPVGLTAVSTPGSEVGHDESSRASPPPRQVIRVQHIQTIRNYVEDDQRYSTPSVELQLSCAIVIDLPFTTRVLSGEAVNTVRESSSVFLNTSSGGVILDSTTRRASRQNSMQALPPDYSRFDSGAMGSGATTVPVALEEVIDLPLTILSAHVEAPRRKLCFTSGDWRARRQEFAFVLAEQFDVDLVEVKELSKISVYA